MERCDWSDSFVYVKISNVVPLPATATTPALLLALLPLPTSAADSPNALSGDRLRVSSGPINDQGPRNSAAKFAEFRGRVLGIPRHGKKTQNLHIYCHIYI